MKPQPSLALPPRYVQYETALPAALIRATNASRELPLLEGWYAPAVIGNPLVEVV